jgi:RNA polymerase sigma factor (sigma-70 family)
MRSAVGARSACHSAKFQRLALRKKRRWSRVDQALRNLAALDQRKAAIVEMRYFGGLSVEETAEALGISPMTVKREWLQAKAWLYRGLGGRARKKS